MAHIIESMLKAFNVGRIVWTCDIKHAMTQMGPQSFDILMIDWIAPHGDGLKLIEWVRNNPDENIQYLPILFLTANSKADIVFSARDQGSTEIMVKPLSAKKLANRLLHIIDSPRPHILSPIFKGPDRRRTAQSVDKEKRVMTSEDIEVIFEQR